MKHQLTITSDGTAAGTKVTAGGVEIDKIARIEISPIEYNGFVTATVTFLFAKLDLSGVEATETMKVRTANGYEIREVAGRPTITIGDGTVIKDHPTPVLKMGEAVTYYTDGEALVYRTGQSAP